MKRKICVVTGTRAEFGLLKNVIRLIDENLNLQLQLVVTGMHLSPEFGLTYREIEDSNFKIDAEVEMLLSADTGAAVVKAMGLGLIGYSDTFKRLSPDLLVVLGDRFEIFSAVTAANILGIPIAHLHGGELTFGAFDDALRHSITKMAHLHFVANQQYQQRVIQLGEHPETVFNFGGLGIDAIKRVALIKRKDLEDILEIKFCKKNLLITFHSITRESDAENIFQMHELLMALSELEDTLLLFTLPNADTMGRHFADLIQAFVETQPHSKVFASLGQQLYFSCLSQIDCVVGNSSSGLLEAPAFKVATVNIGDRQSGRVKSDSVIDCSAKREEILEAIEFSYSRNFQNNLRCKRTNEEEHHTAEKIVSIIASYPLSKLRKKFFYDLPN